MMNVKPSYLHKLSIQQWKLQKLYMIKFKAWYTLLSGINSTEFSKLASIFAHLMHLKPSNLFELVQCQLRSERSILMLLYCYTYTKWIFSNVNMHKKLHNWLYKARYTLFIGKNTLKLPKLASKFAHNDGCEAFIFT